MKTRLWSLALAVALAVIPSLAAASPAPYTIDLYRVKNVAGVVTGDSARFTIEASSAATMVTGDTLNAFYVGGINYASGNGPTNALTGLIRVVVAGIPALVAADTLQGYVDYSNNKGGPWFTQGNSLAATPCVMVNGLGAAKADTTGQGTYNLYGPIGSTVIPIPTVGSNSVQPVENVWSGLIQANPTLASIAAGGVPGPLHWMWARLRLAGDHGAAGDVHAAKVSVIYEGDAAPMQNPGPRQ